MLGNLEGMKMSKIEVGNEVTYDKSSQGFESVRWQADQMGLKCDGHYEVEKLLDNGSGLFLKLKSYEGWHHEKMFTLSTT